MQGQPSYFRRRSRECEIANCPAERRYAGKPAPKGAFFIWRGTMNAQLTLLIELQEIDSRIRTHRGEQSRIPQRLAALEQRAQESKAGLDRKKEALANAQKAKRDRDRDLEEGGAKVEKLKARTSEIKNNKEYQAM